jgi:hypothetical protein
LEEQRAASLAAAFRAARMAFQREYPRVSGDDRDAAAPAVTPRGRLPGATALPRAVRLIAALALAAAGLACDPYVQGNGVYIEVDRTPGPFAGVHVDDGIQATANVSAGGSYTVRLSGEANIVDGYVRAEVRTIDLGGEFVDVLYVWVAEPKGGYAPTIPLRAVIQPPSLRYLAAIRAARLEANEVSSPVLDVEASGGSYLEAKGPAPAGATLRATLSGGHGELSLYAVQDAQVMLDGASTLKVSASGTLSGEAHDASTVTNVVAAAACGVITSETATVVCGPPAP